VLTPVIEFVRAWLIDIIDILIVSLIFYRLFLFFQGTRAAQMFIGLLLIAATSLLAGILRLNALNWLADNLRTVWLIAFVILFQPEIRRGLAQLGRNRLFRSLVQPQESRAVGEIIQAAVELSEARVGALVVLTRKTPLKAVIETGTPLHSTVTTELLKTIFTPKTPLHDGAVVVTGDLLIAAACILPLSQNPRLGQWLGTRHRAAVGVTEETDALALVVSEETGRISIAEAGKLKTRLDQAALKAELAKVFSGP